jgi:5-formyltetrahydrofolate cyclo-ligase
MSTDQQDKRQLRKLFKKKRSAIADDDRQQWNAQLYERLTTQPFFLEAANLFIFVSFRTEIDTHAIIKRALLLEKNVFVPRTKDADGNMEAIQIESLEQLTTARMGLPEPELRLPPTAAPIFDLILVPGLAFDRHGYRLGYGGGYYDKFLSKLPQHGLTLGLAYHIQLTDNLPFDAHDQKLDGVVTEKEVIRFDKQTD